MNLKCSNCGYECQADDQAPAEECPKCGILYANYEKFLEQWWNQEPKTEQAKVESAPIVKLIKRKQHISPILVMSVVVTLALSFMGYNFYQKLQIEKANTDFSTMVGSVSSSMLMLATDSEKLVDEIQETWHAAIFKYDRNFNVALSELRSKRQKEISDLQNSTNEIFTKIKKMKPPNGKEAEFKRLKEIYLVINQYAEMAIKPTGSLNAYVEQNSKLNIEVRSALRELELMR
jgi:hypothetical protein